MARAKLKKRCKTWMCPNLHQNLNGYCDECNRKYAAAHPSKPDKDRPDATKRGYDYRWRKFRKDYLASHPICARCGKPAQVVDHIIPADVMMDAYGTFDYDPANYQALCYRCNNRKGKYEDKRFRDAYRANKEALRAFQDDSLGSDPGGG